MTVTLVLETLVPIAAGWAIAARCWLLRERRRREERELRAETAAAMRELDMELDLAWEMEMDRFRSCS